jgi:hypothetical protein
MDICFRYAKANVHKRGDFSQMPPDS